MCIRASDFKELLRLTKNEYDFITFDLVGGAPLRFNLFHEILDPGADDD